MEEVPTFFNKLRFRYHETSFDDLHDTPSPSTPGEPGARVEDQVQSDAEEDEEVKPFEYFFGDEPAPESNEQRKSKLLTS